MMETIFQYTRLLLTTVNRMTLLLIQSRMNRDQLFQGNWQEPLIEISLSQKKMIGPMIPRTFKNSVSIKIG